MLADHLLIHHHHDSCTHYHHPISSILFFLGYIYINERVHSPHPLPAGLPSLGQHDRQFQPINDHHHSRLLHCLGHLPQHLPKPVPRPWHFLDLEQLRKRIAHWPLDRLSNPLLRELQWTTYAQHHCRSEFYRLPGWKDHRSGGQLCKGLFYTLNCQMRLSQPDDHC